MEYNELFHPNIHGAVKGKSTQTLVNEIVDFIAEKLEKYGSPRFLKGDIEIIDWKLSKEQIEENSKNWKPWSHRPYKQYGPDLIIHD